MTTTTATIDRTHDGTAVPRQDDGSARSDKHEIRTATRRLLLRLDRLEPGTPAYSRVRAEVVETNLSLVRHAARRYRNRPVYEDVLQTGTVGLIKAIDAFDPRRGAEFASYALPTVTGEIKRFFRDTAWALHVPRGRQETFLSVTRARDDLRQRLGRDAREDEIAAHLGIPVEEVRSGFEVDRAYAAESLDAPTHRDGPTPGAALAESTGAEDAELDLVDFRVSVAPLIADLDARDQTILRLRFWDELTQRQIGARLGISQMHVSRLLAGILARLRDRLQPA